MFLRRFTRVRSLMNSPAAAVSHRSSDRLRTLGLSRDGDYDIAAAEEGPPGAR